MSSVCIQLIVVAVTLSLSDVACQTVLNISISDIVYSGSQRRQAQPLTQPEISEIVDRHNILRSLEGAGDMQMMVWSTDLASLAAKWIARCHFDHPDKNIHTEFKGFGQNMFQRGGKRIYPTSAVDTWYHEKPTGGHYKQVVWANSRNVGCAVHYCATVTAADFSGPSMILACNYKPAANTGGDPYTKGPACSMCGNGVGWCKNRLCNTHCSRAGEGCSCAAICYNCAELDLETCRCKCAKGWHGVDCTHRCKNRHPWCGVSPGWYDKGFCTNDKLIQDYCPAFCGLCEPDPHAKEGQCPPVRGPYADSAQTMFIKSHQSTMIFVMVIIAVTISSYDAL